MLIKPILQDRSARVIRLWPVHRVVLVDSLPDEAHKMNPAASDLDGNDSGKRRHACCNQHVENKLVEAVSAPKPSAKAARYGVKFGDGVPVLCVQGSMQGAWA